MVKNLIKILGIPLVAGLIIILPRCALKAQTETQGHSSIYGAPLSDVYDYKKLSKDAQKNFLTREQEYVDRRCAEYVFKTRKRPSNTTVYLFRKEFRGIEEYNERADP